MSKERWQQFQKVYFDEEARPYQIRCVGERFAICTKPFNPRHTVIYTVVDFERQIRGTENLVFGMGAETDKQCKEMLARLESGKSDISHRNYIPLKVTRFDKPKKGNHEA